MRSSPRISRTPAHRFSICAPGSSTCSCTRPARRILCPRTRPSSRSSCARRPTSAGAASRWSSRPVHRSRRSPSCSRSTVRMRRSGGDSGMRCARSGARWFGSSTFPAGARTRPRRSSSQPPARRRSCSRGPARSRANGSPRCARRKIRPVVLGAWELAPEGFHPAQRELLEGAILAGDDWEDRNPDLIARFEAPRRARAGP